jgi:hypothetical protein
MLAVRVSVVPEATAAADAPGEFMCSARSRVGNGMNATNIRNSTFRKRNSRSTLAICPMTV